MLSKSPQFIFAAFHLILDNLKAAMDVYALFFLTMNALSRPRSLSQGILNILLRDGLQFLMVSSSFELYASSTNRESAGDSQ